MIEFPVFLELIKGLGIAGGPVFAFLWWLERKERMECQKLARDLHTQTLTITSQSTFAVTTVTAIINELRETMKDSFSAMARLLRKV